MKKTAIAIALFLAVNSAFAAQRGGGAANNAANLQNQLSQLTLQENQLTQDVQLINQVLQAIASGNPAAATNQIKQLLEDANATYKQRLADYNAARNIVPNSEREYQATKARLIKEAQDSHPEYKEASDKETEAKAKYDAASKACIAQLAKTTVYQKAKKIADEDEAKVKVLRESGSADDLATASEKWMESSSALKEIENRALAADPKSVAAQKAYNEAHLTVLALNSQYEKEVSANPELAAIKLKAADASTQIDAAKQEMTKASNQRDQVQRQVNTMLSYVNNPNAARSALVSKQQALANITSQIQMLKTRMGGAGGLMGNPGGVVANPDVAPAIIPVAPDAPVAPIIVPVVPDAPAAPVAPIIVPVPNNPDVPTGVPIITAPVPVGL